METWVVNTWSWYWTYLMDDLGERCWSMLTFNHLSFIFMTLVSACIVYEFIDRSMRK